MLHEAQKLHRNAVRCVCGDEDDRPQPGGMEANISLVNREAGQSRCSFIHNPANILPATSTAIVRKVQSTAVRYDIMPDTNTSRYFSAVGWCRQP